MSQPNEVYHGLSTISGEILSAKSSLHMYPHPVKKPGGEYLSDVDANASHSIQHMTAAFVQLNELSRRMHHLEHTLLRIKVAGKGRGLTALEWERLDLAVAHVLGKVDDPDPPRRAREYTSGCGIRWVYNTGWQPDSMDLYRDRDYGICQPIGMLDFFNEFGVLPTKEAKVKPHLP